MYNKTDLQYPEHARANEPVKGRKIYSNNRSFHNAGPFLSASLAGVVMFSYLSSNKLSTSAENTSLKPVAAAIVQPSLEPFPEMVSEPAPKEEKDLQPLPSSEPAPTSNPIRVPAPTPEPTPDPIVENLLEPVIEPTPTPSDPEPDPTPVPEPLKAPEFLGKPVIRISENDSDKWLHDCNFTVGLNDAKNNNATAELIMNYSEDPVEWQTSSEYVPDSSGTDGNWITTIEYEGEFEWITSVRIKVDYTMSDGTSDELISDPFEIFAGDFVYPDERPSYIDGNLQFTYELLVDSNSVSDPNLTLQYYYESGEEGLQVAPVISRSDSDDGHHINVSYEVGQDVTSYEATAEFTYEGEGATWISVQEQEGELN